MPLCPLLVLSAADACVKLHAGAGHIDCLAALISQCGVHKFRSHAVAKGSAKAAQEDAPALHRSRQRNARRTFAMPWAPAALKPPNPSELCPGRSTPWRSRTATAASPAAERLWPFPTSGCSTRRRTSWTTTSALRAVPRGPCERRPEQPSPRHACARCRRLIKELKVNHEAQTSEALARNCLLIRELNTNIGAVRRAATVPGSAGKRLQAWLDARSLYSPHNTPPL